MFEILKRCDAGFVLYFELFVILKYLEWFGGDVYFGSC